MRVDKENSRVIPVQQTSAFQCKRGTKIYLVPEWKSYRYHVNTPLEGLGTNLAPRPMATRRGGIVWARAMLKMESKGTFGIISLFLPFLLLGLVILWKPLFFSYAISYGKLICDLVAKDHERRLENDLQLAQKEWRLYEFETRYGQDWCKHNKAKRGAVSWLSALVNDDYAVPTIVLGHMLRRLSCEKSMIVLLSEGVSEPAREALRKVGWTVRTVEHLDCVWMRKKLGQKAFRGKSDIIGTHTRFHAWNYTQFSKMIYVDSDYMPLTNIDDLFDLDTDFAAGPCGRPGVLDPCFNAGLLVFRPNEADYENIFQMWYSISGRYSCPNDQVLLWHYFADNNRWTVLPYTYNVRRIVFRPMKAYHFACCMPPKPWSSKCRPSRREAKDFNGPIMHVDDLAIMFWKNFYEALTIYKLDDWWRSTRFFRPSQEFGPLTYSACMRCPRHVAAWKNSSWRNVSIRDKCDDEWLT